MLVLGSAGKIPAVFPLPSPQGKTSSTRGVTCRKPPSRGILGSLCEPLAWHWLRRALRDRCCGGLGASGGVSLALPRCRMCQQCSGRLACNFNVPWGWFAGSAPHPQSKQVWVSPGPTSKAGAFPWLGACREELFRCLAVQIPSRRPSACGWCLENPWYELHTQNSVRGEGVSRENPRLWASGALHLPGTPAAAPGRAPGADCTQGSSPPDKMQGHEQDSDQMRGDPRKCKTWATLRPDLGVEPCLIIALAR